MHRSLVSLDRGVKFLIRYAHKNFLPELAYFCTRKGAKIMAPLGTLAQKQRRLLFKKNNRHTVSVFLFTDVPSPGEKVWETFARLRESLWNKLH